MGTVIFGRFDRKFKANAAKRAEEELRLALEYIEKYTVSKHDFPNLGMEGTLQTFYLDENEFNLAWSDNNDKDN